MASPLPSAPLRKRREFATDGEFNVAILDVNLDGQRDLLRSPISLAGRGLPFVFVTGYGERSLPEAYRGRPPCKSRSRPSNCNDATLRR